MNREKAKVLLPIIQAFSEGKQIQWLKPDSDEWIDVVGGDNVDFEDLAESNVAYRIKPEPKYRSFKNAEECWNEMKKHQPFGWIKVKNSNCYKFLAAVQNIGIYSVGKCAYETGFKNFTFADGAPFGILEKE